MDDFGKSFDFDIWLGLLVECMFNMIIQQLRYYGKDRKII